MSTAPFTLAGRFALERVLGEGGMGRVWLARDLLLDREVAVKETLPPSGLNAHERDRLRERVLREARAIARIDHPNVIRVIDVLHERDKPWIVMELIPSRSLFDVVDEDGPMTPEQGAEVGLAVLGALRAAHAAGLLHRDVKPANILLGFDGRVVLTDFGLALLSGDSSMTATGVVLGSPSYLAPERALDQPVGPAADLWSLGATLYTAVEGRPPYAKSSPVATLAALAAGEPHRPPVRAGALGVVLGALLERDPARRPDAETADRMLRKVLTADPGMPTRPLRSSRRTKQPVLIGALAVALLVAATAGFLLLRERWEPMAEASTMENQSENGTIPADELKPSPDAPRESVSSPPTKHRPARPAPSRSAAQPSRTAGQPAKSAIDPQTWYRLINEGSGKCVDVRGGVPADRTPVQLDSCGSAASQQFRLVPTGSGYLRIASRLDTDKSLDVTDQRPDDTAPIQLWPYNGRQQWRAVRENDGNYHFVGRFSGKCLDVPGGAAADEVQLDQFSCNGTAAQSFGLAL
ncbi:serine/threonine protein kinase [Actinoplanes sp. NBRC 103695]|uniref:serine/threonine protein kinase n=1 Tax=Actinoplanes sp. NBRC 103695 TaxID=3032202 RepID=UPI0024A5A0A0|nr:serine/threonine protein kinase [Actinoplanes sp. NBRC 103695]GLY97301.1 hypothetical protein Acsp02_45550 [Actinoplanes sp. NBRC 103695]